MAARVRLTVAAAHIVKDCAASPDQPTGPRGRYSGVRFKADAHAFTLSGNGRATEARTRLMAGLPGAELTRNADFAWYAALKNELEGDREAYKHPAETQISPHSTTTNGSRCRGSTAHMMTTPARSTAIERSIAPLETRCLCANSKRDRRTHNGMQYTPTVHLQVGTTPLQLERLTAHRAAAVGDSSTSRCRPAPNRLGGPYGCSSF